MSSMLASYVMGMCTNVKLCKLSQLYDDVMMWVLEACYMICDHTMSKLSSLDDGN